MPLPKAVLCLEEEEEFFFLMLWLITWFSILYIEISFAYCAMKSHAAYDSKYYMVGFSFFFFPIFYLGTRLLLCFSSTKLLISVLNN